MELMRITAESYAVPAGTRLSLTKSQADARILFLAHEGKPFTGPDAWDRFQTLFKAGGRKEFQVIERPVSFKRGEELGLESLVKGAMEEVNPKPKPKPKAAPKAASRPKAKT
ncbi:MAG: hypothetical protein QNK37_20705 [Acidobacteriota bacterium]|nr:hypothetical protein [Acidobacteriota bacterium]